jgi:hypothetical protein
MSIDNARKWAQEKWKLEREAQSRSGSNYETCLHCGHRFPCSEGVVTSGAALCEACSNRD